MYKYTLTITDTKSTSIKLRDIYNDKKTYMTHTKKYYNLSLEYWKDGYFHFLYSLPRNPNQYYRIELSNNEINISWHAGWMFHFQAVVLALITIIIGVLLFWDTTISFSKIIIFILFGGIMYSLQSIPRWLGFRKVIRFLKEHVIG